MTYTWIDYLVIVVFILSALTGLRRGFIREAISLGTLVAAFIIASMFAGRFADWLNNFAGAQSVVNGLAKLFGEANAQDALSLITLGLSFFILFVLTMIAGAIINRMASGVTMIPGLGMIDRFLGAVFGIVRGFLFSVAILFLLSLTSIPEGNAWTQSQLRPYFQSSIVWLSNIVKPGLQIVKDKLGETMNSSGGVYNGTGN
jgi:membrane protein required for colicin V production